MGKTRSRANGEGTIYQNANGTWTAQISTLSGRRSKTLSTQRKAREWLTQMRREIDTGEYVEPSEITLKAWWDIWVETYKARSVEQPTLDSYKHAKNRLSKKILDTSICDLKPEQIQAEFNRLDDKGLKRRTIELTRTPLRMCLEKAVELKKIRDNPVKATTLPDEDSEESVPLTPEEEMELVEYCQSQPRMLANQNVNRHDLRRQVYKDALLFLLRTGVRRSECLEAKWEDWTDLRIHIRGTKNDTSDRMVPLPPDAIEMLKRRKLDSTSEYIFTTVTGTKLGGRNLLRHLTAFNGHKLHDLRHTYCTRAAQAGINPKVLQTITGHKKIETLLKIYTHVSEQDKADAVAKIFAYCKSTANASQKPTVYRKKKNPETLQSQGFSRGG